MTLPPIDREPVNCAACESKLRTIRHLQADIDKLNRELRAGNEHAQIKAALRVSELHHQLADMRSSIDTMKQQVVLRDSVIDELQAELDAMPARVGDGLTPCTICGRRYITRDAAAEGYVCDRCSDAQIGTTHVGEMFIPVTTEVVGPTRPSLMDEIQSRLHESGVQPWRKAEPIAHKVVVDPDVEARWRAHEIEYEARLRGMQT